MDEKKFLETLEDGELEIAAYARSYEEGDNITVTCDLLNAMEQAVGVFNEQKEVIKSLTPDTYKTSWKAKFLEAKKENETLKKDYIELDLECRELRRELDKELAEHEEFTKKAEIERLTEEIKSIKAMSVEQVVESEKLKKSIAEAVNSFVRLETL